MPHTHYLAESAPSLPAHCSTVETSTSTVRPSTAVPNPSSQATNLPSQSHQTSITSNSILLSRSPVEKPTYTVTVGLSTTVPSPSPVTNITQPRINQTHPKSLLPVFSVVVVPIAAMISVLVICIGMAAYRGHKRKR